MSEEEDDDGTFIRHRYAWRSHSFNEKLEERIGRSGKKTLARKRTYGSPINQPPPPHCQECDSALVDGSNSEEILMRLRKISWLFICILCYIYNNIVLSLY